MSVNMLDSVLSATPDVRNVQSRIARLLFRVGVSANVATMLALVAGVVSGIAFARGGVMLGLIALAISAGLDAVDGTIARECAAPSVLGGVFDLTADRVVEIFVLVGIAWRDPALYFPALVLVGSWYVNITVFLAVGAALERRGPKLIEYPPGILERTEAIIFFAMLAIVEATAITRPIGPILAYVMTALEVATGAQRLMFGIRLMRAQT
jgi:phosphatidylglycerophosphate synthase